jgi:hypothetical protein
LFALFLLLFISPVFATTYYLSPTGSDSNNGLSTGASWLSPNHAVNCGDVIIAAASTSYLSIYFNTGNWGTVTCAAGNNVAWLKCATFDACKITYSGGGYGQAVWIDKSYWGMQGWEVSATGGQTSGCWYIAPAYSSPASLHHIVLANNVANGCFGGGFSTGNNGNAGISFDYVAIVGNIAYNAAQGNRECYSGISIYQPLASDTLSGTHIYIAGNFSWANVDPSPCASGTPTDGEGIIVDSLDGGQGLGTVYAYQVVVDNNLTFFNGGRGVLVAGHGNTLAPVYLRQNAAYGDNTASNQSQYFCGEIESTAAGGATTVNVQAFGNIAQSTINTGCGGLSPIYAWSLVNGNTTNVVHNNWIVGVGGDNTEIYNSGSFAYRPNNMVGTSAAFANPVNPGAPNCSSASSVPACMATVIADYKPTASGASIYGYQVPSSTQTYDPLFPLWLCNVNLPSGLVSMGCLSEPKPTPPSNLIVTVS